ncbi:hypothetical protein GCM10012275_01630 [Longimycelium tulufanense]|uniref:Uncharacterized protein n=1 Tax=Longimycelium tulufanense TaxID=907463 RepID=A0A8J3FUD2_9PSEU|nr:hypothetical protein GCM10012275_01630 [Longimycelium tulufanense]
MLAELGEPLVPYQVRTGNPLTSCAVNPVRSPMDPAAPGPSFFAMPGAALANGPRVTLPS